MAKKKAAASGAARSRKKAAPPPESEAAAGGSAPKKAIGLIAGSALRALVKQTLLLMNKGSTIAGELGDLIRDYAEKKNLHRGAYTDIKKLYRMGTKDPAKLWLHLAHFDHMRAELKLDEMAAQQEQMLPPGTHEPNEQEADEDQQGRAARTGEQVRAVAETAGAKLN